MTRPLSNRLALALLLALLTMLILTVRYADAIDRLGGG